MKINLNQEIKAAKHIAILGHVKPDGDCIGSATALYHYIGQVNPAAARHIILDTFGGNFEHISVMNVIQHDIPETSFDLCFCMDCASRNRLGRYAPIFDRAKRTVVIDHHVTGEPFGDVMHVVPHKSSTCEVLYDLMDRDLIDRETAVSLYTGLISDTGVFKYASTTSATMRMAAALLEKDIPFTDIIDRSYFEKTYKVNRFIAKAVLNSKLALDGRLIYTVVSREMMRENDIQRTELEGIVEQLRNTEGAEVALFIYELSHNAYKVSLRSKHYVDVAAVAAVFNGGGHIRAAGCTLKGEFDDLFPALVNEIGKRL
ncbi:MAG: bifunctional oligoribonuclease/PAP phosphatase NrnA [Eubacteriales bacterium]|nr:bifunctional oligoribonuclease/PAP phosphatase NrnA [Eubacteriales bacterium]